MKESRKQYLKEFLKYAGRIPGRIPEGISERKLEGEILEAIPGESNENNKKK